MSNFSSQAIRLRNALTQECFVLSQDIAGLGAEVSGGTAGIIALQAFDFLAQQAQMLGLLLTRFFDPGDEPLLSREIDEMIAAVPLPRMQARLRAAVYGADDLTGNGAIFAAPDEALALWVDE